MRDTWMPDFHFEMVKRTITMAMDRNARGCEAASLLLSFLYGRRMITTDEFGKGIERLFEVIGKSMIQSLSTVLKPKQVYCKTAGYKKKVLQGRSSIVVDGVGDGI